MLPSLGAAELLTIAIVALILIGPKELPTLLRSIGRFVGAFRRTANAFRDEFNRAVRDSELENLRDDLTKPVDGTGKRSPTSGKTPEPSIEPAHLRARASQEARKTSPPESPPEKPSTGEGLQPVKDR